MPLVSTRFGPNRKTDETDAVNKPKNGSSPASSSDSVESKADKRTFVPKPGSFSLPNTDEQYQVIFEKMHSDLIGQYKPSTVKSRSCVERLAELYAELSVTRGITNVPFPPSGLTTQEAEVLQRVRHARRSAGQAGAALDRLKAGKTACETRGQALALAGYIMGRIGRFRRNVADATADQNEPDLDDEDKRDAAEAISDAQSQLGTYGPFADYTTGKQRFMQVLLGVAVGNETASNLRAVLETEKRLSERTIRDWQFKMQDINQKRRFTRHALDVTLAERAHWAEHRRSIDKEIRQLESELTKA